MINRIDMKFASVIFSILFISNLLWAKEIHTVKLSKKNLKTMRQSKGPRILCNQKYIPMKVEQSLNAGLLTVSFTAERKIENFSLKNVRGADGLQVVKFQELMNQKLEMGEVIEASVELGSVNGLGYVIFDVDLMINSQSTSQSIPVAVGNLSAAQKVERSKNIKEIKNKTPQKNGTNTILAPSKIIHEMKLE